MMTDYWELQMFPMNNLNGMVPQTNKAGREEAKSDPIIFTYNPSRLMVSVVIVFD